MITSSPGSMTVTRGQLAVVTGIILVEGVALYAMGHPLICANADM